MPWVNVLVLVGFLLVLVVIVTCDYARSQDAKEEMWQTIRDGTYTASSTPTIPSLAPTKVASCPTPEEAIYLDAVGNELLTIGISMLELEDLLNQLASNPSLYYEDEWRRAYVVNLEEAQASAKVLSRLEAPSTASQIDSVVKSTASYVDSTARESLRILEFKDIEDWARNTGIAESYAIDAAEGMLAIRLAADNFC